MKQIPKLEVFSLLTAWVRRPDSQADLRKIFGVDRERSSVVIDLISRGDFSWVPAIKLLPSSHLGKALGAYSRETGDIYLSQDCPETEVTSVLLEEIGHHLDALFNEHETPGDEGALFSAVVRGVEMSPEELTALLNEDDSATLLLKGKPYLVECSTPRGPASSPPLRPPSHPITTVGPHSGTSTNSSDWETLFSGSATLASGKHGLSLVGAQNLLGYGNSGAKGSNAGKNTLSAASNSGNSTLIAGTASTTMRGGSGNDLFFGSASGKDSILGGTGNNTIVAGNGSATLVGGSQNNLIYAGNGNQSLWGGNNNGSTLYGNTLVGGSGKDTLRAGTGYSTLLSGSATKGSNTLISAGIASSLVAGNGNDSLYDNGGLSTLIGGPGSDTLNAGITSGAIAFLQSGSAGNSGNTLIGGSNNQSSTTLVAGSGNDSLLTGAGNNLLLINANNIVAFGNDHLRFSTQSGTQNHSSLGISSTSQLVIQDSLFANALAERTSSLQGIQAVIDLPIQGNASQKILLGTNAEQLGVQTLISGKGADTLSVAGYSLNSALLDASKGVGRASLIGGGIGGDTFLGSQGGYDTMLGSSGNDSFVIQASALAGSSFGLINGNGGNNTLSLGGSAVLSGTNFNGVSNVQVLQLGTGNNSVGSLQGSGILKIIGNTGSDTLSANVYGAVKSVTRPGSSTITLNVSKGTSLTMGFSVGQAVTGNGIPLGTTITNVSTASGSVILTLSQPTTSLISQGAAITGWLDSATLDGSAGYGLAPTDAAIAQSNSFIAKTVTAILEKNIGVPNEYNTDLNEILSLQYDPRTYIHRKGDLLTGAGQNEYLVGSNGNSLPPLNYDYLFQPYPYYLPSRLVIPQYQVVDNTLVSGAFASNTLVGGSGANLYLINNQAGVSALPTIENPTTLQSASTIQFTGNSIILNDAVLSSVSQGAAQKIITANGNNLIAIGQKAAQIGIQTIIGGVGSDTFVTPSDYTSNVYFDALKNGGSSSLVSGFGNDTLLGGSGNDTLIGGDGNNSIVGGSGNNLIKSGVGNSTLDSGYGISTLQADGGTNIFVVRNRYTRILAPDSLNPEAETNPEFGIVNTYVNFDPIQGAPQQSLDGPWQFAPGTPDNSPSITKSASFASSDLSSFYNLKDFNLLGQAVYGVGNALSNSMTSSATNAVMLGMGGYNTLVSGGAGSSLYGDSNASYASPDLYAYAPTDTRDQQFVDGVMGVAENNSLVANGNYSYLDGGPGSNDGLFDGSGANTLIGNGYNDTFYQSHQADVIVCTGGNGLLVSSVNLNSIPDNISQFVLNVTPELDNSGGVTFAGQRVVASKAGVGTGTNPNSNLSISWTFGDAPPVSIPKVSHEMQVGYGLSAGTVYASPGVNGANLTLSAGTPYPDPQNQGKDAVAVTWTTPLDPNGNQVGQILGYDVQYQCVAEDGGGNILSSTPWLTYVNGTSQDLSGTSINPRLLVDNLPTSFTDPYTGISYSSSDTSITWKYQFKVTAQETVLPASTNANGNLIAQPVSLIGGQGNNVLYGGIYAAGDYTLTGNRPVLTNNPINPNDPSTIVTPAPWTGGSASLSGLFPTYLQGGNGNDSASNDFLWGGLVNDGSGNSFTSYEYLNGVPTPVTFSGLNTLVGGSGSDTFIVSNGGTSFSTLNGLFTSTPYDNVIKYGKETPVGQKNLIVDLLGYGGPSYLTLSDTTVSQGMFINTVWAPYNQQYVGGNRLDDTLVAYGALDTLQGGVGKASLVANMTGWANNIDTLIGGTAYGGDSIYGALLDQAAALKSSIYRDTSPVPANVNGPGGADNSQYWYKNGIFDPYANSDTLVAIGAGTDGSYLDGGAGNDSMVGCLGNDTIVVSNGFSDNYAPLLGNSLLGADVVTGGGGDDTIIFTGSDVFWSGITGATTQALSYTLSNKGDAAGGLSISNLILQANDPVARNAYGNHTSTGNQHTGGGFGIAETGSNLIVGNGVVTVKGLTYAGSGNDYLDGGGVGGSGANGTGVGVDTLIGCGLGNVGNAAWDTFNLAGYYTGSSVDSLASGIVSSVSINGNVETDILSNLTSGAGGGGKQSFATDGDWAIVNVNNVTNYTINLHAGATYLIGSAPSAFGPNNIKDGGFNPGDFGIYAYTPGGNNAPNLVAEVIGANPADFASLSYYTIPAATNGTTTALVVNGLAGVNDLGNTTETIAHLYTGTGINSSWYKPTAAASAGVPPVYGGDISQSALVTQANTDVHNFLAVGAMYNLDSSNFASHINLV
jgi:Ca2+-binding RTX toxin-like protein